MEYCARRLHIVMPFLFFDSFWCEWVQWRLAVWFIKKCMCVGCLTVVMWPLITVSTFFSPYSFCLHNRRIYMYPQRLLYYFVVWFGSRHLPWKLFSCSYSVMAFEYLLPLLVTIFLSHSHRIASHAYHATAIRHPPIRTHTPCSQTHATLHSHAPSVTSESINWIMLGE